MGLASRLTHDSQQPRPSVTASFAPARRFPPRVPRILPIYTPVVHPKLKKLLGDVFDISQGPAVDIAENLHHFGSGQVSQQLMGQTLDEDTVGMLSENETNVCECRGISILMSSSRFVLTFQFSPSAHSGLSSSRLRSSLTRRRQV